MKKSTYPLTVMKNASHTSFLQGIPAEKVITQLQKNPLCTTFVPELTTAVKITALQDDELIWL